MALPLDDHLSGSTQRIAKSRSALAKATEHVGEYTRVDPRSGKKVKVRSYDRSVVARLEKALASLGPGGKVDLPNGLGSIRRRDDGTYTPVDASGLQLHDAATVIQAVDEIATKNGGGLLSGHDGAIISRGKNHLHPKEQVSHREKRFGGGFKAA